MKKGDITGTCTTCKEEIRAPSANIPGYGRDNQDNIHCFDCCAEHTRQYMHDHGKIALYLVKRDDKWHVTDWGGSLDYYASVSVHKRGHFSPFAGYMERRDAWFIGPDGTHWHGRSIGSWTQIVHCTRLKHKIDGLASTLARTHGLERIYP